ncbi:hypothetical protein [Streptomyces buecherae]|uniref:Uncharacterized protein n=1 Tax=Streptomyces buecherae TaxID=2763006 RepID=A0A7H8NAQ6_9ACTN|nr:hypothetical protein [Streptomyces buecherae]QKW51555.1 hypothetical protein HUT08_20800 [Streptomyces buecherae]
MSDGDRSEETTTVAFDFNVDVRLTVKADPGRFQFVNMTIGTVPGGATQLDGTWRGASVFVPSTGGDFHWDGTGQGSAILEDSATNKAVVGLLGFRGAPGKLPGTGASGNGEVLDPVNPQFREAITWKIT